ncbi:MAG TPA: glutamine--fructose-6-phosphate transaminase (isomerizing) [Acidimicrobiales bacterium]|nr:glutamine--fructose-6-phosphate transaminase (isomerizing) [Acidimicrobiales bacterium]
MCGIIGVTGDSAALGVILEGLHRLEYRGYDSAGVALVVAGDTIWRQRRAGGTKSLPELTAAVDDAPVGVTCGIGHNRWATHGGPTESNAHPHVDASGKLALVHNGIIDNYRELAAGLPQGGAELTSETDSEVLAHVIAARMADTGAGLADATRAALREVRGKFSIGVVHVDEPDLIVGARRGSPLICGVNDTTAYLASDIPAIHGKAKEFFVIDDERVVELRPGSVRLTTLTGDEVTPERREVTWDLASAEKGGYPDFMLKEIHEQPDAVRDTLLGRIDDGVVAIEDSQLSDDDLRRIDKVFIVGCGTSYNAGLVGELAIEHWAKLSVESDIASEFRYRDPVLSPTSLVVAISQSGESLDTMEAVTFAKRQRAPVLSVCNVVDSSMARDSDAVIYTHAGPEICVASTKTHVAQIAALNLLALQLAQVRGTLYPEEAAHLVRDLQLVPDKIAEATKQTDHVKDVAEKYRDVRDVFFIGRQVGRAMAQEGALKLKELSYVRAEAYPAGELKHGPIALIEPGTLVVAIATRSRLLDKIVANIQEVKARGASILALATDVDGEGGVDPRIADLADDVFVSPYAGHELFTPMVDIVALQLFAYYLAKARGNDVDKPRNLAKTVTVE